jgi:hypothetical protein
MRRGVHSCFCTQASQNKWSQLLPSYVWFWFGLAPHDLLGKLIVRGMGPLLITFARLTKKDEVDDPDAGELGFHVRCLSAIVVLKF